MLNRVVNKTGKEDNLGILNKVVNTTAIDKDLVEANPVLQTVVNTIDVINPAGGSDGVNSCVVACIDKNVKEVQCVACINTCEISNIKNTTCVTLEEVTANYICSKCIEAENFYVQDLRYDTIQVNQCTESPKAVVAYDSGVLCSSHSVCVDDDTVYSNQVCSNNFYGTLNGKSSNADCFDGRTFEEAKTEILSGKAKCSELADYAKNVCIESCTSGSGFIPFVDNKCVIFLAEKYNPKVMFNEDGIEVNIDGCISSKSVGSNDITTQVLNVSQCAMFNSPVYFYNDIYQCGESWCTHAQNIYTCSDTITMREGATFAGNAQIKVCKYDGTNNGVIFLGTDGTLRVGDENNCQPVLTRSEEENITDNHVLVWDATNKCAKDGGEAVVTCAYVNAIGTSCKEDACLYTACADESNRTWTEERVCTVGTDCYNRACACAINVTQLCYACSKDYADTEALCSCVFASSCGHTIGTECYKKACCCAINMDALCYACAKAYTDTSVGTETSCRKAADTLCTSCAYKCASTVGGNACAYAVSCSHSIGTSCKTSACNSAISMDALCLACSYACGKDVCTSAISRENTCLSCAYACVNSVCCNTINRDTLCLACSCAYTDTKALCSCAFAVTCGHAIGKACNEAVCCNTITRDTLCLSCAYACARTKGENACTYASGIGTACKNAACSFAVSCSHAIGTSCKNDATATKANCYGNSYSCVQCSYIAKSVDLETYTSASQRYVYIGQPNISKNIGCNPNFWFCPTCNVLTMGDANGSAICLTGEGSCLMKGVCSRKNPSIVFATTDKQCGCLQYSQYDSVHLGAGLCWATNTPYTWFDTDCIFANKFINRNGCQIGGYCATIPSPNGNTKYALLDFGAVEASVYFSVHDNEGTIVKANTNNPYGKVYAQNTYGITGFYSLGTEGATNACFWLRYNGWRDVNLWGKYPIKVVSNTTTNPGCTWQSPTIKPTCDYVNTVAGQCKSAACTYANTVAGQCKAVACTYAHCTVNSCKGIGVMGVARITNGNCWTKGGYWAYMTSSDGPNCCWNHVIKMDWSANVDPWITGISIPTYNAPRDGIYYKAGCCGGHSGWTLVPNITCVQTLSSSCASSIGTACKNAACSFAAACAQSVVPETSTFAKCYGNSNSCVAYANKVRIGISSTNNFYKIPFIETANVNTADNRALYIDNGNNYPSYNPSTNVFCGYTVCVAQTLAVRNANGGFRLGNYCIYIE